MNSSSAIFFNNVIVPYGLASAHMAGGAAIVTAAESLAVRLEAPPVRPLHQNPAARLIAFPVRRPEEGLTIPEGIRASLDMMLSPKIMKMIEEGGELRKSDLYNSAIQYRRDPNCADIEDDEAYEKMYGIEHVGKWDLISSAQEYSGKSISDQSDVEQREFWIYASNVTRFRKKKRPKTDSRIYLPISCYEERTFWARMWAAAEKLGSEGVFAEWKIPTRRTRYFADDSAVIYFRSEDSEPIYRAVVGLFEENPKMFAKWRYYTRLERDAMGDDSIDLKYESHEPLFAAKLMTPDGRQMNGISFAQSTPRGIKDSFHGWLAGLALEAIETYLDESEAPREEVKKGVLIDAVAGAFAAAGLSLKHIAYRDADAFRFLAKHSDQPL